ncbi:hypothetical protein BDW42DRAFT_161672 [Aspergillus taichungensis]|uniref:Uncharacterized protein n=1 Tax=Aspergillus taichungensis TaxID=482145 RepID=A0A2J5I4J6_9EURO|nr:hypothetical protein BDW42DRAFT_161672 [Aspergillus taichungensis]
MTREIAFCICLCLPQFSINFLNSININPIIFPVPKPGPVCRHACMTAIRLDSFHLGPTQRASALQREALPLVSAWHEATEENR